MSNDITLIASTKDEVTTDAVDLHLLDAYGVANVPVSVWTWDIAGDEKVEVMFPTDKDAPDDWEVMHELDVDKKYVDFEAACRFKLKKSSTADDVGVKMAIANKIRIPGR